MQTAVENHQLVVTVAGRCPKLLPKSNPTKTQAKMQVMRRPAREGSAFHCALSLHILTAMAVEKKCN